MEAALLLGVMLVLLALGIPIAFSIGLSSALFILVTGLTKLVVIPQRIIVGADSFVFLAIPLFTLSGYLMESGGLSKRLVSFVEKACGNFPGSMGTITIICCTIFAALTGSGPATVAAIGGIMIPSMLKAGYSKETSAGIVAAGGALGPIVPPSVTMIIYGAALDLSIPDMFMASIIPGLFIALVLIIVNTVQALKRGIKGSGIKYTSKEKWQAFYHAIGVLFLPVIILGGIYGGIFTPTEAAAVACVYTVILGIVYKELTIKSLIVALKKTVVTSAMVVTIIAVSNIFSFLLASAKIPQMIAEAVLPIVSTKNMYLLVLMLILFVVGCLMDTCPAILILGPILVPIGIELGVNPLHLGVIYCINLVVGFITPPFGINLFTAASTAGVTFAQVVKGILPYLIAAIACVMVLAYCEPLVAFLPNLIHG